MKTQLFLKWSILLSTVLANPLPGLSIQLQTRDTKTVGITESLLSNFKLFANFTAASYCPNNENATANTPVTCPNNECDLAEASSPTVILSFGKPNDLSLTNIKGFVALDTTRSLVIVAFAGSGATIRNWLTDFTFLQVPYTQPGCSSCWVHSGFITGWVERRSSIMAAVTAALAAHPTYSLVITGHSIGGAVGTLAAAEFRISGQGVDLYTFGSPAVGNKEFASFVTGQAPSLGENYRVTHVNDPVPQIPPMWLGYYHLSPEYWLAGGTDVTNEYAAGDVVVCEGVGNRGCNIGTGVVPIDGTAHDHYLGDIGACQGPVAW